MEKFDFSIKELDFNCFKNFDSSKIIKEIDQVPLVYFLYNEIGKYLYIGETANLFIRMNEHLKDEKKRKYNLEIVKIICSPYFNKSVVYDIETKLLEYISADENFILINKTLNQNSHNFYQKEKYISDIFEPLWKTLLDSKLVFNSLASIENKEIFKYSPFKAFTTEQLYIVEEIIYDITNNSGKNIASLIEGEPGTGKSLLLVRLVYELIFEKGFKEEEITVVLPQKGLHKTFKKIFKSLNINKLNINTGTNINKKYNKVLIIDEAHRLKQMFKKQIRDMKHLIKDNTYTNELNLAIENCDNLILCYDPQQTIRPADIDTEEFSKILQYSKKYQLTNQFRIKLGKSYLIMLKNILQIHNTKMEKFSLGDYELKIFDSIEEMHKSIIKKDIEFGLSRMASGYSWKWESNPSSKKNKGKKYDELGYDIIENEYKLRWNYTTENWAHSKNAINEVGSIHTLQGVDLNYVGVIIGEDLIYNPDTQKLEVVKEKYFDEKGKPIIGTDNNNLELSKYIRNIYYVLMTRGIRGTYIYFKDKNLKKYFKREFSKYII